MPALKLLKRTPQYHLFQIYNHFTIQSKVFNMIINKKIKLLNKSILSNLMQRSLIEMKQKQSILKIYQESMKIEQNNKITEVQEESQLEKIKHIELGIKRQGLQRVQVYKWYWDRKEELLKPQKQRFEFDRYANQKLFQITKVQVNQNRKVFEVNRVNSD
ncbi:UNKNOWN [Stylonychia lemnae]|uniref:Uncharacterized protein n=1 Tax=Stylonychia lemnae TaxID=5949 RepID=A0A077ZR33_STYLE|nr:UNKNOWN [Stylonychia lemnae]|eukprot:CDW72373.1 UNKNOWN [Stylonychia lemnae]